MNKVAAFALRRKNSILSMSEKMFCPPQPLRLVWVAPACAGKSTASRQPAYARRDHPRVCGEKYGVEVDFKNKKGSPPRMRGKVYFLEVGLNKRGITPACAGKRQMWSMLLASARDHPRVCGEKAYNRVIIGSLWGSPPHVRGKGQNLQSVCIPDGITPAHAGKSQLHGRFDR